MAGPRETDIQVSNDPDQDREILNSHLILEPPSYPRVDEAKLSRKIDLRVLPILFTIYVAAFLDRVNISNALTLGLPVELGLVGNQQNIALTIFFAPYIIFEIPSNILMKKLGPRIWLSACILSFGIIMIGQGFVRSYSGLLATRFFLGLAEAGIFPVYWSSTIFAGAFGGLLASAIANMDGIRGLSSWRWVFILEGIVTVLVGLIALLCVTDFPREAKWLSQGEKEFLLQKTGADESNTVPVTTRDVLTFLTELKHWFAAIIYLTILIPSYSIVYFLPTIIRALGYTTIQTQLHSVPPFAAALGFAIVIACASDKLQIRSPFIFLGLVLLISGLAILISVHGATHFSAEYAALCLVTMGSFGVGGNIVCWYVMNLRGHVERSIGSAWMMCFGNIGGIIATFLFLQKDAPYYISGYSVCLAMSALSVVSCASYGLLLRREIKANLKYEKGGNPKNQTLYL